MTVLNIFTPGALDLADSYGLLACQLARYLARAGVYVNLFAAGPRQAGPAHDPELAAIIAQPIRAATGGLFLGYPVSYGRHPHPLAHVGPRVGMTMFESSKLPAGWVPALNACDAVITPSTFCREVFQAEGVTAPVTVAPLGINPAYAYAERPTDGPLTFLAFIDRGMRKGGIEALQAFVAAFGEDMSYRLILKGRTSKVNASILNPNVELIQRDMSEAELYQLYLRAHVLINPHRGEGFGLIPREAASSGCLSLVTNWSGTADDLSLWGVPLAYRLVQADWRNHRNLAGQDLGQWAEVDSEGLVATLRRVADNWRFYRSRARVYARNVRRLYSWERFAGQVLQVWEGVANGHSSRQIAA